MTHTSKYFYGNKISDYGLQNGFVDYACLAKSFDAVLANGLMEKTHDIGYWEQVNGGVDYEEIEELENRIEELEEELQEEENENRIEELEKQIEKLQEEKEELENYDPEIFQYFIVSDGGARILEEETNEILFYNEELDLYIWGITHWGTSWDYVLTDIRVELKEEG